MFSKEEIRGALAATLPGQSPHLRNKRILFQTRRPFTEMLETYRSEAAPRDRDNDPLFLQGLTNQGVASPWLQDCPWEVEREEPLTSQYPLNVSLSRFQEVETISFEHGWTIQRSLAALIYTGLLYTYPQYEVGDSVKINVLYYPQASYQPNQEYLEWQNKIGKIAKNSNVKLPWESVKIQGVPEPVAIRKDWIRSSAVA